MYLPIATPIDKKRGTKLINNNGLISVVLNNAIIFEKIVKH